MNTELDQINLEIKNSPKNAASYLRRAEYYYNLPDITKSLDDYDKAIEINSKYVEAYNGRGELYCKLKEYDKALADYNEALVLDATSVQSYIGRGRVYCEQKEYDKAIEDFNKAIELDSTYAKSYLSRGRAYHFKQDYDRALADYNKSIELDDKYALAYYNTGIIYGQKKDYDRALINYSKCIELDDKCAQAYNNRGNIYKLKKKYSRALADYNKSIELNNEYAYPYNNRASIYRLKSDYDKALADYNKAIELASEYANAYLNLGNVYYDLKQYSKALQSFNIAYQIWLKDGDYANVQTVLGRIKEIEGIQSKSNNSNRKIKELLTKIDKSQIEDTIHRTRISFCEFIAEKPEYSEMVVPEFVVLRRWNSYTPIIANNYHISKGGGYFFNIPNCGIVIDPGFNFIDNFQSSGFKFWQIDHILITHAHNDHTSDLESILTLLYKYNELILGDFDSPNPEIGDFENDKYKTIMQEIFEEQKTKPNDSDRNYIEELAKKRFLKSKRYKRIRIYMTASTFKKYSAMLDLYRKADYDIIIIKSGDTIPVENPQLSEDEEESTYANDLKITAINAKHEDLLSDRDSLGFIIEYNDFILIYTGDTGYNQVIEDQYKNLKESYKNREIILLAHLGGFKEREKMFDASKNTADNANAFYKKHLGRLGLGKIVEVLQPTICIISEFGEEFLRTRCTLTKIYNDVYKKTTFFAADIGLSINTEKKIKVIDRVDYETNKFSKGYVTHDQVATCERRIDASLHYYKRDLDGTALMETLVSQYYQSLYTPIKSRLEE